MTERKPFDGSDPFDAAADMYRRQVAEMVLASIGEPPLNRLEGHRQIEAIIAGVVTGLVGSCFGFIEPSGQKAVMKAIKNYLPQARQTAIEIIAEASHGENGSDK